MMGHRQDDQAALFYEFSLERHVPDDHLLRLIDRFVELGGVRRELASFYSTLGRPSIDPELMIRMLRRSPGLPQASGEEAPACRVSERLLELGRGKIETREISRIGLILQAAIDGIGVDGGAQAGRCSGRAH
jgi:hypothetical protein